MTDPLSTVEAQRNRYRRALEIALQDLRIIHGALARAKRGEVTEHVWRSLHGQADAARYRLEQALRVDE
jgi:hypothetical protein